MDIKFLIIELAVISMGAVFGLTYPTESWKERLIAGGAFMVAGQLLLLAL
jgi:hypothetical protein